jgi:hypothetical protein
LAGTGGPPCLLERNLTMKDETKLSFRDWLVIIGLGIVSALLMP